MDAIAEWTAAQDRVIQLLGGLPADDADTTVAACPAWTVRELLAHMVGLDADVLAGDEPDDHNAEWTQRQVVRRADSSVDAIVDEWIAMTVPVQEWMRANNTRPLGDVIIHEQDLRGALDRPGGRDTDGLAALRDRMAGGFDQQVRDAGLPAIALLAPDWQFTAGDGDAAVTLRAGRYDLTRALMSRRSAGQLREWTVDGDVTPYLPMFGALGELPPQPLVE